MFYLNACPNSASLYLDRIALVDDPGGRMHPQVAPHVNLVRSTLFTKYIDDEGWPRVNLLKS